MKIAALAVAFFGIGILAGFIPYATTMLKNHESLEP